jgi:integrase
MAEIEENQTVNQWFNRLSPNTARVARSNLNSWMNWIKVNGSKFKDYSLDDLVEYQKQTDNGNRFDILDTLVQPYLKSLNLRASTKKLIYANIRSFFLHNRAELPTDPSLRIRSEKEPVKGDLTVEEIKKAILASKPTYQAAFLCMFQGAMDQEMFTYWNKNGWKQLQRNLKDDPDIIRIDLPGRKLSRNVRGYYTFIGLDSIEALKNWLQHRPENAEAILTDQFGKPLTKTGLRHYWTRLLRRLGIVPAAKRGRGTKTGKGLHEMRDVFRSQWSLSPADHRVAEYVMGHQIDSLEYDKSYRNIRYFKGEYRKALPKLQIISSGEPFGRVDESEVEQLKKEVEKLRKQNMELTFELTKKDEALEKAVETNTKQIEELRRLLTEKISQNR